MKRKCWVLAVISLVFLSVIGLLISAKMERDRRSASIGRLYQVGLCLRQYALSHDGRFPDSFHELGSGTLEKLIALASPHGREKPSQDSELDYVLVPGRARGNAPGTILAYRHLRYSSGAETVVLYTDGMVKWVDVRDLADIIHEAGEADEGGRVRSLTNSIPSNPERE